MKKISPLLLTVLTLACALPVMAIEPHSTTHRNLFAEWGHSEADIQAKVQKAYQQFFHGDPQTQSLYFPAGKNAQGPLAQIRDINSRDVRSEGMSYGMMITVQLDQKAEFDALWNWAYSFMLHQDPNHPAYGYFSWSMTFDGTPNDEMPAPDGEEYFAMALYFASHRWGNGQGLYNYQAQADQLLTHMRHRQPITGQTLKGEQSAGNLFCPTHKIVRFTPGLGHSQYTDPSYHLPAFYELWAQWGPQTDRDFWQQVADTSRDFFVQTCHAQTGLSPDYAHFDGSPWRCPWNPHSKHFTIDAWRTAMNWSMDWAWWAKDSRQQELSNRLLTFFVTQGMDQYASQYTLAGVPQGNDHSPGLVAMNATAALAATIPTASAFVQALWDCPIPEGRYRYYDGMLYTLGLLHCSGEYRIWWP